MNTATSNDTRKVLLVENNADDLRLVRDVLGETSSDAFDLIAVKGHTEAIERLAGETIDVILLALSLPDAPGLEILTRMRAAVPHLPIVVVTEGSDETSGLQAVRAGAQDYLLKDNLDSRLLKHVLRNAIERKRSDQVQRESERRYRSLFENMLNGFAYCKMEFDQGRPQDFLYLEVNAAFETLTGLKNVVGKNVSEVIPGIQVSDPELFASYGRVAWTGQPETLEIYVTSLAMWFSIAIYSPQREYFVAIFEMITERKRTEEELARYRDHLEQIVAQRTAEVQAAKGRAEAIVNNSVDGILLVNAKLEIQQSNSAFNTLFACATDDYLNQPLTRLAQTEDVPLVTRVVQAGATAGQAGTVEIHARRKDGTVFDAEFSIGHIKDDGLVCTIRDITDRKQAEDALRRSLEQQKELVDLKSRFISMASHDFRNPMSVILSSISLLEMQITRQFGAEQLEPLQKRLRRIDQSVRQMTSLLDDVLTVNRADAGKVEIHAERLDVERLGNEFLQEIQLTAGEQHRLNFSFAGPETSIVSDPQLLRQILINLLSNAVKYSPAGGNVHLDIRCAPENVEFRVQDEGIGIPEPDQARLFEVFHRAHNVGDIHGTGLGMAIVKRAVDALGGTIAFDSQVGVGTTFTVRLPATFGTS